MTYWSAQTPGLDRSLLLSPQNSTWTASVPLRGPFVLNAVQRVGHEIQRPGGGFKAMVYRVHSSEDEQITASPRSQDARKEVLQRKRCFSNAWSNSDHVFKKTRELFGSWFSDLNFIDARGVAKKGPWRSYVASMIMHSPAAFESSTPRYCASFV